MGNQLGNISLGVVTAGYVGSKLAMASHFGGPILLWDGLLHFTEAGMVGGLADWFAVTVLFKKIPHVPHTGLLLKGRAAVEEKMVGAIKRFAPPQVIQQKIHQQLDVVAMIKREIEKPEFRSTVLNDARTKGAELLSSAQVDMVRRTLIDRIQDYLSSGKVNYAEIAGTLLHENVHTVDVQVEAAVRTAYDSLRPQAAALVTEKAKNLMPMGLPVPSSLIDAVIDQAFNQQVRERVEAAIMQQIRTQSIELQNNLALQEVVVRWVNEKMQAVGVYHHLDRASAQAIDLLVCDLQAQNGNSREIIESVLAQLVTTLQNEGFAAEINSQVRSVIASRIDEGTIEYVANQLLQELRKFTDAEFVEMIKSGVWDDLQYVRLNGALVGGFAGLAIFLLSRFIG